MEQLLFLSCRYQQARALIVLNPEVDADGEDKQSRNGNAALAVIRFARSTAADEQDGERGQGSCEAEGGVHQSARLRCPRR